MTKKDASPATTAYSEAIAAGHRALLNDPDYDAGLMTTKREAEVVLMGAWLAGYIVMADDVEALDRASVRANRAWLRNEVRKCGFALEGFWRGLFRR